MLRVRSSMTAVRDDEARSDPDGGHGPSFLLLVGFAGADRQRGEQIDGEGMLVS